MIAKSALAAVLLSAASLVQPAFAEQVTLTVAGSGGGLAQVMKQIFEDPFTQETGIAVKAVATTDRASALKAMMAAGKSTWDVSELSPVEYATASANGWLVKIDWSKADPENRLPAMARLEDAVVTASYSTILAVRTDKLPAGREMTSWADFWDVKRFPGPRALQNSVLDNLEFALIADGVAPADVYQELSKPQGVDRAFAKLDAIKPHIAAWWTAGAQPVQMLTDGEVHYTSAWNGRITKLASEGTPAVIVWNGGALKPSYDGIIKGTKHLDEAHAYIRYLTTSPERAAAFVKMVPYPGFVNGLYDHLPPEMGKNLPTYPDNAAVQFATDAKFWGANMADLRERWDAWLLD
jgi:putative spermidine/putrescine transport system substrate-binding protein